MTGTIFGDKRKTQRNGYHHQSDEGISVGWKVRQAYSCTQCNPCAMYDISHKRYIVSFVFMIRCIFGVKLAFGKVTDRYRGGSREVIVKVFMSLFTCTLGKTGSLVQVHIMYTFQGQLEIKKSSINGAMALQCWYLTKFPSLFLRRPGLCLCTRQHCCLPNYESVSDGRVPNWDSQ